MNGVLIGQHSASHDRREVERLLLSPKASTLDAFLDDLFRKCIAWHEANVGDLTFAEVFRVTAAYSPQTGW